MQNRSNYEKLKKNQFLIQLDYVQRAEFDSDPELEVDPEPE